VDDFAFSGVTEVTYTKVEAVEPTTEADGHTEYWLGSDGGYYSYDEETETYTRLAKNEWFLPKLVPYIDANGNEAFCTNATKITSECISYGGTDEEDDLWYYVDGTVETSNYLNFQDFSGSTNIILCDGASLKVNRLEAYNVLNIYIQAGETPGTITATPSASDSGDGVIQVGGASIYGGNIIVNGNNAFCTLFRYQWCSTLIHLFNLHNVKYCQRVLYYRRYFRSNGTYWLYD
jgi:hypothetical protein